MFNPLDQKVCERIAGSASESEPLALTRASASG